MARRPRRGRTKQQRTMIAISEGVSHPTLSVAFVRTVAPSIMIVMIEPPPDRWRAMRRGLHGGL